MKFSTRITVLCKKRNWSLTDLSKKSGVPVQTIHNWSTGRRAHNIEQVKKVATALETSIHDLLFGEPDPFEQTSLEILDEIFTGDVRVTLHRIQRNKK